MTRNYTEKGDEDALMCEAFYKEIELQQNEENNLNIQKQ